MLHRGKTLEDELRRALDHVRASNEFLEKFVGLLESVDEEEKDGKDGAASWKEVAERVKSVVKGVARRDEEKDGSVAVKGEKELIVKSPAE